MQVESGLIPNPMKVPTVAPKMGFPTPSLAFVRQPLAKTGELAANNRSGSIAKRLLEQLSLVIGASLSSGLKSTMPEVSPPVKANRHSESLFSTARQASTFHHWNFGSRNHALLVSVLSQ